MLILFQNIHNRVHSVPMAAGACESDLQSNVFFISTHNKWHYAILYSIPHEILASVIGQ